MVKWVRREWGNGGRPTVISLGFGTLLTLIFTVVSGFIALEQRSIDRSLSSLQRSVNRIEEQTIDREKCLEGRIARLEGLFLQRSVDK